MLHRVSTYALSQNSCCENSHLQPHAAAYAQNTFKWNALVVSTGNQVGSTHMNRREGTSTYQNNDILVLPIICPLKVVIAGFS